MIQGLQFEYFHYFGLIMTNYCGSTAGSFSSVLSSTKTLHLCLEQFISPQTQNKQYRILQIALASLATISTDVSIMLL